MAKYFVQCTYALTYGLPPTLTKGLILEMAEPTIEEAIRLCKEQLAKDKTYQKYIDQKVIDGVLVSDITAMNLL